MMRNDKQSAKPRNRTRFVALCLLISACSREGPPALDVIYGRGGEALWIDDSQGRLKAESFASSHLSEHPVLVVVLHGDLFDPTPSYQYGFAQALTQGFDAPVLPGPVRARLAEPLQIEDTVAVGILRPGYVDNAGDRSGGERGNAVGDNYTPEVVDAIARAVQNLKSKYSARSVVLVGHSGGAAISADVLGRHPDIADAALLVGCACDPDEWRSHMSKIRSHPMWKGATRSLQPLDLASSVRQDVIVRLVVGQQDDVAPPEYSTRYADALKQRGVDARVTVAPGLGHNIMFQPIVFSEFQRLIGSVPSAAR